MKYNRVLWTMLIITFVLASGQGYARTPDRALQNPLFLAEIGKNEMIYAGYATGSEQILVSYAAYDEFANGYGAFTFLTSGQEETSGTISFVAVKEYGNTALAFGIYRGNGETHLDVGAAYGFEKIVVRAALHKVPLMRWVENKDQISVSLGGSVDITDTIQVGVDLRPGDTWQYEAYSQIEIMPYLTGRIKVGFRELSWQNAGVEFWASRNQVLVHLGYTLSENFTSDFYLGIGFRF